MSEANLRIGTVGYPVRNRDRVLQNVTLVELTEGKRIPPSPKTARKWRSGAPGAVGFTVQMSNHLFEPVEEGGAFPGEASGYGDLRLSEENLDLWKRGLDFAAAVEALALVLVTPSRLTPSRPNQDAFAAFLDGVKGDTPPVIWEPHGPWEIEQAADFAAEKGLVLAVDPLRDDAPEGPLAYFRLGPFSSMGSRLGIYDLERLADAAAAFERTMCVFDTPRALDDARNLTKLIDGQDLDADLD